MFKTLGKKLDSILKTAARIELEDYECGCDLFTEMEDKYTDFMKEIGAEYISSGSCRVAYRYRDKYVIKIATSKAGIAQNKNEVKFFNGSNPVCNTIVESSSKGYWILAPYAEVPENKHIKAIFGVTLKKFDSILGYAIDGNYAPEACIKEYEKKFKGTPFFNNMVKLTKNIMAGDIASIYGGNFGIVNNKLVVIDGGLTRQTYNKYY